MFQIYHDYPNDENINPLNSSRMPKQNMVQEKKQVLRLISNSRKNILITNKMIKNTTQGGKKDAHLSRGNYHEERISKHNLRKHRIITKKQNIHTHLKKNLVVQYAKKPSQVVNKWEKETDFIISTTPDIVKKQTFCYVEVYNEHVKDEYFKSVKSNILSKYPQWKYIFEQNHSARRYEKGIKKNSRLSLLSNCSRFSPTINYVQVYDDRCKEKYYKYVKDRMFLKYPSWKSVFGEVTCTKRKDESKFVAENNSSIKNYKKLFKEFWYDIDNHPNMKVNKKESVTLNSNYVEKQNTRINTPMYVRFEDGIENEQKYVCKTRTNCHVNISMYRYKTSTFYIVAMLVLFFITPVNHEKDIINDCLPVDGVTKGRLCMYLNESPSYVLLKSSKKVQMQHPLLQQTTSTTRTPHTQVISKQPFEIKGKDMNIINKNSKSITLNNNTNIVPIQITPYPLSSKLFLKYNIVVETGAHTKDINIDYKNINIQLDNYRKDNGKNNDFDVKIFRNAVQQTDTLNEKTIQKIINLSPISKKFESLKTKADKGGSILDTPGNTKQSENKKVKLRLPRSVREPDLVHNKVTISFSSHFSDLKSIQVNSMVTFQTIVKGFVEKYTKTCVFVEDISTKNSDSARSCKSLATDASILSKQAHLSEFNLKFQLAGVYRIKALLLHPRNGKLSEVFSNEITATSNDEPPMGTDVSASVLLL